MVTGDRGISLDNVKKHVEFGSTNRDAQEIEPDISNATSHPNVVHSHAGDGRNPLDAREGVVSDLEHFVQRAGFGTGPELADVEDHEAADEALLEGRRPFTVGPNGSHTDDQASPTRRFIP